MNVDAFKDAVPAGAFAVLNPQAESLSDGIGTGYGVVTYKGKVWRLRHRGETYQFNRPDDGTPAPFLDVIVLRSPNYKSKSYYPKDSYVEGNDGDRPTCSALDGVTPDLDIANPQAQACAICPRNEFKLNAEGRKTRECADYKRLAVLIIPSMTARAMGAALMEPVFLRIPPASLNDLATLGDAMAQKGFHYSTFVTRIGFNPDKPHPQMVFKALQPLKDGEGPLVLPMREDGLSYRITGERDIATRLPGAVRAVTAAVTNGTAMSAVDHAAALAKQQAEERRRAEVAAAEAVAAAAAKRAAEADAHVDTGFGVVAAAAGPKPGAGVVIDVMPNKVETATGLVEAGSANLGQTTAPVGTMADTVADVGGEPGIADADLDARVAAMLAR
jgi:hypothetical protein